MKEEKIYRMDLQTPREAERAIKEYMDFYNTRRMHQSLNYKTPEAVHFETELKMPVDMMDKSSTYPHTHKAQQQQDLNNFVII